MTNKQIYFFFIYKCTCFVFRFLFFILLILGTISMLVIFVLRPKKPIFSVQALNLTSFTLNTSTDPSTLCASGDVLLNLKAHNPNKVGIRYGSTEFYIFYKGLPVGVAKVPHFYQPAHSKNVSLRAWVKFERVNVGEIVNGGELMGSSNLCFQVAGDIKARLFVSSTTLPMIKLALDCQITMDNRKDLWSAGAQITLKHKAIDLLSHLPPVHKKCSLAVYV